MNALYLMMKKKKMSRGTFNGIVNQGIIKVP